MRSKKYVLGILALVMLFCPLWGSEYVVFFFTLFFLYLALSEMWNLLAGYSGLISLGQQSFIGIGGYSVAVLCNYYEMNLWLSVLLGGVFSSLLALFMSLFIFRMKGIHFAIGTWIFGETLLLLFSNWKYVGYGMGLFIQPASAPTMNEIYYASFITGVGSVIVVYGLLRSRLGLGLISIRDDEAVAEVIGVDVFRSKLYCFIISAFVTGVTAGVLFILQVFIQPYSAFAMDWTVKLVFIVIIGGIGTIEGPLVGSLLFVFLSQRLAEYFSVSMLIFGGIAIIVILAWPKGIIGTIQDKLGFEILSTRRTLEEDQVATVAGVPGDDSERS
jgi:branched-chain amino acid transport system permease protein